LGKGPHFYELEGRGEGGGDDSNAIFYMMYVFWRFTKERYIDNVTESLGQGGYI
jgi:hypothetical protein